MNDEMPSLNEAEKAVNDYARKHLQNTKQMLEREYPSIDSSEITKSKTNTGTVWSFVVETNGEFSNNSGSTCFDVRFALNSSEGFEGEMFGYNVSVNLVWEDGLIIGRHAPKNYTEEVWTDDLTELENRARNIPPVQKSLFQ